MSSNDLFVASLLTGFFEAGWSIQVLIGDADKAQYESSRLARPEVEKHLLNMTRIAQSLPDYLRDQIPAVDWQSWIDLGAYIPPHDAHARNLIWTAIHAWLPPTGQAMRQHRRQHPELWQFKL